MTVTPYAMESLTSFVHRAAAMKSMDSRSFVRSLFPSPDYQNAVQIPDDLDALDHGKVLGGLTVALDPLKKRLDLLTLPGTQPGIHTKWLRRAGGNGIDGDTFGAKPSIAWCPRCLLCDQASGHDQFLRLSWRLVTRTLCWNHRRPLTTHCLACNDREAGTAFIFDGRNISLACRVCGSYYATQLGLSDMSGRTALALATNRRVQAAWNGAIQFEQALERNLSDRSKRRNKREFQNFVVAFANMLMKARRGERALIDLFVSPAFPARRNPHNITSMSRPYRASSIAVRRKTHGIITALLKGRTNLFTINGLKNGPWGRDPTFQEIRADLEPEQNAELDRLLLSFPAKWF
ncbi:TniQ family protein [Roseovarius sp. M141]|uniref:TniQ family protein n=1 Tax=Roseovarius sp. M141 TaxID=2583806 RepID=UPI0020CE9AE3|nr:TniQ family protein [Roseovarius sp. M141]MCQ0092995.1 hypothetical protein [Roseovarius sp. M141]